MESFDYKENLTAQSIVDNETTIEQRAPVGPAGHPAQLPAVPGAADLLQVRRRRRRPLRDRRQARADADLGPRAEPGRPAQPDLGEPPPRLHPRLRRGGVAEQLGRATTASRNYLLSDIPPRGRHPARPARDLLRREPRRASRSSTRRRASSTTRRRARANATTRYRGTGGVKLSSWLRRAAFALRFNDLNVLISGQITPKTQVLYLRDIKDRVEKAAPFLQVRRRSVPGDRRRQARAGCSTATRRATATRTPQSFDGDRRARQRRSTTCATR